MDKTFNTRQNVLNSASNCVNGHRTEDYGSPERNFEAIAQMWTAYLKAKGENVFIRPHDAATMMALMKCARIATRGTLDCFVDLAGYAACGGELWLEYDLQSKSMEGDGGYDE